MRFHLRQIEIWSCTIRQQLLCIGIKIDTKVKQSTAHHFTVDGHMLLRQVPATWTHQQCSGRLIQFIVLSVLRIGISNGLIDRIAQIHLSFYTVAPCRRIRIFKICHEHLRTRIQRIDDHLSVYRSCDLHSPVLQVCRYWRCYPVTLSHRFGFCQKIRQLSFVYSQLTGFTGFQQLQTASVKLLMQFHNEFHGFIELRLKLRRHISRDFYI